MNLIRGQARYLLLAGIALFAFDGYLLYQSATGGGIPAETELTKVTGEVVQVSKVTVTKKVLPQE